MSQPERGPASSNDGRWLAGWLLQVMGRAMMIGVALGAIGALMKWGLEVRRINIVTMVIFAVASLLFYAFGQYLMKISPKLQQEMDEEVQG
jgi:hypothetical protein